MTVSRLLTLVLASVALPLAAHADTFSFSYTGTGTTASGTLTGDLTRPGVYLIDQITGTRNGVAITGLNNDDFFADQLLYFPGTDTGTSLTPTFLDNDGIAFFSGGESYNIFTSVTRPTVVEDDFGPAITLSVSRGSAVTPEPTSLALLGTGLCGIVGITRRRLNQS